MKVLRSLVRARVLLLALPALVFFCQKVGGEPGCIGQNDGPGGKTDFFFGNGCPD